MNKRELSDNFTSIIWGLLTILFLVFFCFFCVNAVAEETEKVSLGVVVKDEDGDFSKGAKIQLFVWEDSKWVEVERLKTDKEGNAFFENNITTNKCYKFVELRAGSSGKLPDESERIRFAYVDASGMVRYSKSFYEESSSLGDNPTAWPIPIVNK